MRLACISGKLKGLTQSRCKRENQNASNSAAFNEVATSQQLLLSRLPLGFAAFDQRPCFLPDTRSWRFMPAPKVRKNPKSEEEPIILYDESQSIMELTEVHPDSPEPLDRRPRVLDGIAGQLHLPARPRCPTTPTRRPHPVNKYTVTRKRYRSFASRASSITTVGSNGSS